ncbi:MAG TPA: hypothetical protein VJC08_04880 [bacterium]|nr:hypothetical protein [bacterium]
MIGIFGIASGCATLSDSALIDSKTELQKAKQYADQGEYYRARKTASVVLQKNPDNPEAKQLIADVINQEVAQYKELFESKVPEELTGDEQSSEVQALLERSRSLLQIEEYDEALTAAEKVFSYEPENAEASRLIDEIRKTAMKDGQAEVLVRNKIAREESRERVGAYLLEARKGLQTGRVGAAGLALNKILLLDPENEEALKMRSQLNEHAAYEAKKS